eukprot:scpid82077/ scgid9756/ 
MRGLQKEGFAIGILLSPPYTGKPAEFKERLFAVEEALRSQQPADPMGCVASFLDGSARRWLMTLWEEDGRSTTWKQLKLRLKGAFEEKHEEERRRLLVVRARQTGSLEDYIAEYTSLCLSTSGLDELTKALLFTEGLADPLVQKEVRQHHPETLADAVWHAHTVCDFPSGLRGKSPRVLNAPEDYELREVHGST